MVGDRHEYRGFSPARAAAASTNRNPVPREDRHWNAALCGLPAQHLARWREAPDNHADPQDRKRDPDAAGPATASMPAEMGRFLQRRRCVRASAAARGTVALGQQPHRRQGSKQRARGGNRRGARRLTVTGRNSLREERLAGGQAGEPLASWGAASSSPPSRQPRPGG